MSKKQQHEQRIRRSIPTTPERRNNTFSYHASHPRHEDEKVQNTGRRAEFNTPPKKKPWMHWLKQIPIFMAGLLILISLVDSLILNTNPKIVLLSDSSTQVYLRNTTIYQQAAQQLFARSLFNRNKLTVNTVGISNALVQQFPELMGASIALPLLGHRPVVYISPDIPALILASQNRDVFIVADTGKTLVPAKDVPQLDHLKLPTVIDQSGLQVQVGQPTLPANDVAFIKTVVQQLQAQQVPILSMTLPAAVRELDVRINAPQPYDVKFNLQTDVKQQVGTLIAMKNYLAVNHINPSSYIDLRVTERAYYK